MPCGKVTPGTGGSGLEQNRCALRRRLRQMRAGDAVARAFVVDGMDAGRIGIDPRRRIGGDGAVFPARLLELVDDLGIFLGPAQA